MNTPVYAQTDFRGKYDTGTESSTDWIDAAHTNWSQVPDTKFRIRFAVDETSGNGDAENNQSIVFQYNHESTGWNPITTTSSYIQAVASDQAGFVDGNDCTQQLSTGNYNSSNAGQDEDGTAGGANWDPAGSGYATEFEICLTIVSGDVNNGDTIGIRCTKSPGEAISTYTYDCSLTVNKTMAGTAAVVWGAGSSTLTGTGDLAGTSVVAWANSATISATGKLEGIIPFNFLSGDGYESPLTARGKLEGTAAVTWGAGSSTLTASGKLEGTSTVVWANEGTLTPPATGVVGAPYILRRLPWDTAPQYSEINWDHPLAKALILAWLPNDLYRHRNLVDNAFYPDRTTGNWVSGIPGWGRAIETGSNSDGYMHFNVQGNDTSSTPYLSHFGLYLFRATPGSDLYIQHTIIGQQNTYYTRYGASGYHERWYYNGSSSSQSGNVTITNGVPVTLAGCRRGNTAYIYKNGVYQTSSTGLTSGRPHVATSNMGVFANTSPEMALGVWLQWNRGLTEGEVRQLHENPFQIFYRPRRLFISGGAGAAGAISGTCSVLWGDGASTLTGSGALAGTSAVAWSNSATATATGELQGTSAVTWSNTGTLTAAGKLEGTSVVTWANSGTLTATGKLEGTSAVTWSNSGTLTASGKLEGTSTVVWGETAALTATGKLEGTCAVVWANSGALEQGAIEGTCTVVWSNSGTLTGTGKLEGTSTVVWANSGTLEQGAIEGTSTVTWGSSGTLTAKGALDGTSTVVWGYGSTSLTATGKLEGTSPTVWSNTGNLLGSGKLQGASTVQWSNTGTLKGYGALTGTGAFVFSVQGTLSATVPISGTAAVLWGHSADLTNAGGVAQITGTCAVAWGSYGYIKDGAAKRRRIRVMF